MDFAWFEDKRLWTLKDRGLDFRDARHLFDGRPLYTYPSPRDDEDRFVSVGVLELRFIAVIWMERDGAAHHFNEESEAWRRKSISYATRLMSWRR